MYGAIIGDLAGSIYEFGQIKQVSPVEINNVIEPESFVSDDSILTMAIADAILNKKDYDSSLREWGKKYIDHHPDHEPYFKTIFSPGFTNWILGDGQGTSAGNGAMMRVSPVGYLFDTEEEVIKNAREATIPSHNSDDAVIAATLVSLIIFHARNGMKKEDIMKKLGIELREPKIEKFNFTCADTVDVCLYSLFNSNSFEEAIKKTISFGGDTDTNACIVGSMAEAMYGIPEKLKEEMMPHLPLDFLSVLADYENHIQNKNQTTIPKEK
jgi:ADP-ribosylglycohydrolase